MFDISAVEIWFYLMHFLFGTEHQSSPVGEMGDTLEFNEIYQEVKGSWVSILTIHLASLQ